MPDKYAIPGINTLFAILNIVNKDNISRNITIEEQQ